MLKKMYIINIYYSVIIHFLNIGYSISWYFYPTMPICFKIFSCFVFWLRNDSIPLLLTQWENKKSMRIKSPQRTDLSRQGPDDLWFSSLSLPAAEPAEHFSSLKNKSELKRAWRQSDTVVNLFSWSSKGNPPRLIWQSVHVPRSSSMFITNRSSCWRGSLHSVAGRRPGVPPSLGSSACLWPEGAWAERLGPGKRSWRSSNRWTPPEVGLRRNRFYTRKFYRRSNHQNKKRTRCERTTDWPWGSW